MSFRKIPKAKIDGTHSPRKIADSLSPLNQSNSEKIRESKADAINSLSDNVKFSNIYFVLEMN
jgi:hypothetical protein